MNELQTERLLGENPNDIARAATHLLDGALVAIPTETVYGLAARSDQEDAIRRVYDVKGRNPERALSVLVPNFDATATLWRTGPWIEAARTLATHFWPGPLTIICPALDNVSPVLRGDSPNVGLRCPAHPVAQRILQEVNLPLVAPSANLSESPSPTSAEAVAAQLDGKISAIVEDDTTIGGLESTILSLENERASLVRAGAISLVDINAVLDPTWQVPERHVHSPHSSRLVPTPASADVSIEIYAQGSWRTYEAASVDALIQGLHAYLSTLSDGERGGAAWRAGNALRNDTRFAGICYLMDRYLRNR